MGIVLKRVGWYRVFPRSSLLIRPWWCYAQMSVVTEVWLFPWAFGIEKVLRDWCREYTVHPGPLTFRARWNFEIPGDG